MLPYFVRHWGLKEQFMDKVTYWRLEHTSPCFHTIHPTTSCLDTFYHKGFDQHGTAISVNTAMVVHMVELVKTSHVFINRMLCNPESRLQDNFCLPLFQNQLSSSCLSQITTDPECRRLPASVG